jgi:hypothetical protein
MERDNGSEEEGREKEDRKEGRSQSSEEEKRQKAPLVRSGLSKTEKPAVCRLFCVRDHRE